MPTSEEQKARGVVSVTEVLGYFKEPWYTDWMLKVGKKEAKRVGTIATKVGSRVDELIKEAKEPTTKDSEEVKTAFSAFKKWQGVYRPTIEQGRQVEADLDGVLVSGEPDIFVDKEVLVDIKCARKISWQYEVQVQVYNAMLGYKYQHLGILRLDKTTGGYQYEVFGVDKSLVSAWVGLARLYKMATMEDSDDGGAKL